MLGWKRDLEIHGSEEKARTALHERFSREKADFTNKLNELEVVRILGFSVEELVIRWVRTFWPDQSISTFQQVELLVAGKLHILSYLETRLVEFHLKIFWEEYPSMAQEVKEKVLEKEQIIKDKQLGVRAREDTVLIGRKLLAEDPVFVKFFEWFTAEELRQRELRQRELVEQLAKGIQPSRPRQTGGMLQKKGTSSRGARRRFRRKR